MPTIFNMIHNENESGREEKVVEEEKKKTIYLVLNANAVSLFD